MPKLDANGARISYQQFGQGPDIVFVHGLAASRAFWYLGVARRLASVFRVTLFDLRGHGYSDMPNHGYAPGQLAEDLAAVIDALGLEGVVLVGHSYGGAVSLVYTARNPDRVRRLVLADTRINSLQPRQRLSDSPHLTRFERRLIAMSGEEIDWEREDDIGLRFLEVVADSKWQALRTEGQVDFVPFNGLGGGNRAARQWLRLLRTTTAREDFRAPIGLDRRRLARLWVPTLLVYGEHSRCMPSCVEAERRLPSCSKVVVPRAGHFHPATRPRFFLKTLAEFLPEGRRMDVWPEPEPTEADGNAEISVIG